MDSTLTELPCGSMRAVTASRSKASMKQAMTARGAPGLLKNGSRRPSAAPTGLVMRARAALPGSVTATALPMDQRQLGGDGGVRRRQFRWLLQRADRLPPVGRLSVRDPQDEVVHRCTGAGRQSPSDEGGSLGGLVRLQQLAG